MSLCGMGQSARSPRARTGEQPASASVGGPSETGQQTQQWRRTTGHHSLMKHVGKLASALNRIRVCTMSSSRIRKSYVGLYPVLSPDE